MRTQRPKTPIPLTEEEQQQFKAELLNEGERRLSTLKASYYKVSTFKGRSDISATMRQIKAVGLAKGVPQAIKILRRRYQISLGIKFDEQFGVITKGIVCLNELTVMNGERKFGGDYDGMDVGIFPYLISVLPSSHEEFTFVDFGAGMGRAVLLASNYEFRKIIGVEFTQELCVIMEQNIDRYSNPKQQCFNLEAVCMDVTKFPIPDGKCVLFFFNPFKAETLLTVARNITEAYKNNPRKIYVIFYNLYPDNLYPRNCLREILDKMESFKIRATSIRDPRFLLFSPFDFAVYESEA